MASSSPTIPAPETEDFETTVSFENGESIVVKVTYPRGRAIGAIHALRKLGEVEATTGLLAALRDDPSVAAAMAARGVAFDDEDDD